MTVPRRFVPVADHGLLVEFATEISDDASANVLALDRALADNPPAGVIEVVPGLVNLLMLFDPMVVDHAELERAVTDLAIAAVDLSETQLHEVQVCYDPDLGPDLAAVAAQRGISIDAVIEAHLAAEYRVGMYGFAPGYAYLAGVAESIQVPRKPAAVPGVPAGRVLIAGPQCLVTTIEMPTGWSIIGSSPTRVLLDDQRHDDDDGPPVLFNVGDRVRFRRIDRETHDRMSVS